MAAVSCCNSQSETLIFGNKPIRLPESSTLAFSSCHDLGHALKKNKKVNKNKETECGLAWYVLLYTTICGMTVVHLATPQHFDHCDEELSLNSE